MPNPNKITNLPFLPVNPNSKLQTPNSEDSSVNSNFNPNQTTSRLLGQESHAFRDKNPTVRKAFPSQKNRHRVGARFLTYTHLFVFPRSHHCHSLLNTIALLTPMIAPCTQFREPACNSTAFAR
ncbi:hypothetical protein C1H46_038582 [Malus baccata]|uniref:Uncharacterized protein n=1 Tax=Malus baccata TaxID=106549 RepID=A0A540KNR6_MALBA|nr:hypothetical protein C1H46_038582 [Malus baccata]